MRLKELREQANLSQTELAQKLGIVRSTICQYEKGNREPDVKTLERLADIFNVSVDYLLGRDSVPTTTALTANESFIQEYGSLFEDNVFRRYTRVFYLLNSEQRLYMLGYVIGVAERYGIKADQVI